MATVKGNVLDAGSSPRHSAPEAGRQRFKSTAHVAQVYTYDSHVLTHLITQSTTNEQSSNHVQA